MRRPSFAPGSVLLGKYRVESVLGRGGMGIVVRAHHLTLDEVVAIKVLSEELNVTSETFARFMREAKAAAKLRSAHVVRVTDVGRLEDGMPYMVMELLDGRDLAHTVKQDGPLAQTLVIDLVLQVCEVLAEAHALGIIHRDIKPPNLFITTGPDRAPFIKVLDFGIAKAPSDIDVAPITRTMSVLGTPSYMSPEQLRSTRSVDHRTDIWALGVVLYELLEGRRPFPSQALPELCLQIATEATLPLRLTQPALSAVVARCLEKEADKRFQSVTDLAVALAPFATNPGRAQRDIERMYRLARASADRISDQSSPAVYGRLEAKTAAVTPGTADAVIEPANPSAQVAIQSREVRAELATADAAAPPRASNHLTIPHNQPGDAASWRPSAPITTPQISGSSSGDLSAAARGSSTTVTPLAHEHTPSAAEIWRPSAAVTLPQSTPLPGTAGTAARISDPPAIPARRRTKLIAGVLAIAVAAVASAGIVAGKRESAQSDNVRTVVMPPITQGSGAGSEPGMLAPPTSSTSTHPTSTEPTSTEPRLAEPTSTEPRFAQPTSAEPTSAEPTSAEPKPAGRKPTGGKPSERMPKVNKISEPQVDGGSGSAQPCDPYGLVRC